jgi:hypothetical protein
LNHFEVYLLKGQGTDRYDAESVAGAILAEGRVHLLAVDPHRAVYQNPDTGVSFHLTLAPPLVASLTSRPGRGEEDEEVEEADDGSAEEGSIEEDESAGEEEVDDDEEEEGAHDLEMTPLVLNLPPLAPAFYAREALEFADRIARACGLHLEHLEPHAGTAGAASDHEASASGSPPAPADILSTWDRSRREMVKALLDAGTARLDTAPPAVPPKPVKANEWDGLITVWSPEKAEAWWRYGSARAGLLAELGEEMRVPILQAARHEGRVKSLCDFEQGSPAVLPRTDLVLLRRERSQKGLFRTKRVVEEGLVPGDLLWEILAGSCERRREPVDLLIIRDPASAPQDVAARFETLALEPLAGAKRATLFGVIDFDPRG